MSNVLPDVWTWDSWFVDDGERFHAYYLKASRALRDPDRRHFHVTVGHAISRDLREWEEVEDALIASDGPAFDDYTTWTGSVVRDNSGLWWMFYTGTMRAENATIQRIGAATSNDLYTWTKVSRNALCEADSRWYEKYDGVTWPDEAWRDPWVFRGSDGWHMLITARANVGGPDDRGVIGHATSQDLRTWTVREPLSEPGQGFGHLEVPQIVTIDGRRVLVFSSLAGELSSARRNAGQLGGVWALPIESERGPFDVRHATRLTDESLYAGRLVQDRAGRWNLLAFQNRDATGEFVGAMSDPLPVGWDETGRLRVLSGNMDVD